MDAKVSSKHNLFFTIVKFFLFLIIFCFLVSLTKEFLKEVKATKGLSINLLFVSMLSSFMFYAFFVDLNELYKKIQQFFFHTSQVSLFVPAFIILLGIFYFILPKVFHFYFDRNVFVFMGGFLLTSHLVFIARETKGITFADFVNYLFMFSILYIINLLIFSIYLTVAFEVDLAKIVVSGLKGGAILIRNLFTQLF
ncbi:MAG: hypothetical protein Q8O30_02960 [Candidatus Omnitrophota bacterium]|nr:hypothetical protein [Candidatus Omnitrophota bacterium]